MDRKFEHGFEKKPLHIERGILSLELNTLFQMKIPTSKTTKLTTYTELQWLCDYERIGLKLYFSFFSSMHASEAPT